MRGTTTGTAATPPAADVNTPEGAGKEYRGQHVRANNTNVLVDKDGKTISVTKVRHKGRRNYIKSTTTDRDKSTTP